MMRERQAKADGRTRIALLALALGVIESAVPDSSLAAETSPSAVIAQLPRYSASGTHRCDLANGETRSCVVSGLFDNCGDAQLSLRARDCCQTTKGDGASSGFTLTYCIPDISRH